jgi:hypothetical protein
MTPQELAALPKGARVKFDRCPDPGFDYGTVVVAGVVCQVQWNPPPYDKEGGIITIIDTKSEGWTRFVADISLDTPPEKVWR